MSFTTLDLTDAPHFNAPFGLNTDGTVQVVSQNSAEDVASCVYNIASCSQGQKYDDPTFGIPSPLFGSIPLNTAPIVNAIQQQEPRATIAIIENVVTDQSNPGTANLDATITVSSANS